METGIWGLDGPSKLSHFICRACKNSLLVQQRLRHRHISTSQTYQICGVTDETIILSHFECSYACAIWHPSEFADNFGSNKHIFFGKIYVGSNDELRRFATLAWAAWMCRNKALFDTEVASPMHLAAGFTKLVTVFREYIAQVTRCPKISTMVDVK